MFASGDQGSLLQLPFLFLVSRLRLLGCLYLQGQVHIPLEV